MPNSNELVLETTKKTLGVEYDFFDSDILTHINAAFDVLSQLGVQYNRNWVDQSTTWADLDIVAAPLGMIEAYIYLKVRQSFDPPQNSFGVTSVENMIKEYESRILYEVDNKVDDPMIRQSVPPMIVVDAIEGMAYGPI